MQFIVHGHHLELTDSLKERCRAHVLERAEKLVDDTAARLEIELSDHSGQKRGKADKSCRIDLRVPGLAPIHVTEMRSSMHEAIDLAADRLVEALRRGVEKKEDRRRSGDIRSQVLVDDASPAEESDEV